MPKDIVVIDTFSTGHHHEVFNFCMLHALARTWSGRRLVFYGDASAWHHIASMYSRYGETSPNLEFRTLKLIQRRDSIGVLLKFLVGALLNIRLMYRHRNDNLVFFQLNPFFAAFYPVWHRLYRSTVHLVCHGELEYLIRHEPWYKPLRLYRAFLWKFLTSGVTGRLTLVVLGESIKANLLRLTKTSLPVLAIAHPYIFEHSAPVRLETPRPLVIGVPGAVSASKGFSTLVQLADRFRDEIIAGRLVFRVIGYHRVNLGEYPLLTFAASPGEFLTYSAYNEELATTDALMYLYPGSSYRLIASGAIFDAVSHGRTVLAIENDFFKAVFEEVGNLGDLAASPAELGDRIEERLQGRRWNDASRLQALEKAWRLYHYKTLLLPFNLD